MHRRCVTINARGHQPRHTECGLNASCAHTSMVSGKVLPSLILDFLTGTLGPAAGTSGRTVLRPRGQVGQHLHGPWYPHLSSHSPTDTQIWHLSQDASCGGGGPLPRPGLTKEAVEGQGHLGGSKSLPMFLCF